VSEGCILLVLGVELSSPVGADLHFTSRAMYGRDFKKY
jgi:hypothetical protein